MYSGVSCPPPPPPPPPAQAVELKYGEGSEQLKLAVQLVKDCIATATKDLVAIYNGRVLVQGVVLEWEYP